jgi:hypothetical protein
MTRRDILATGVAHRSAECSEALGCDAGYVGLLRASPGVRPRRSTILCAEYDSCFVIRPAFDCQFAASVSRVVASHCSSDFGIEGNGGQEAQHEEPIFSTIFANETGFMD